MDVVVIVFLTLVIVLALWFTRGKSNQTTLNQLRSELDRTMSHADGAITKRRDKYLADCAARIEMMKPIVEELTLLAEKYGGKHGVSLLPYGSSGERGRGESAVYLSNGNTPQHIYIVSDIDEHKFHISVDKTYVEHTERYECKTAQGVIQFIYERIADHVREV